MHTGELHYVYLANVLSKAAYNKSSETQKEEERGLDHGLEVEITL